VRGGRRTHIPLDVLVVADHDDADDVDDPDIVHSGPAQHALIDWVPRVLPSVNNNALRNAF
jgi:hypothetical protein